jgi:Tfp pilus assembly protein PilE
VNLRFSQSAGGQGWFNNADTITFTGNANFYVSDPTGDLTSINGNGTNTIGFRPTYTGGHESQSSAQWQIEAKGITEISMAHNGVNQYTQFMIEVDATTGNKVILTVEDIYGNASSAEATVILEDNIVPTAITQNITVALDANGVASIDADDIDNGSNDNCSITSKSIDIEDFDCSNVGANSVLLTVNDASGNYRTIPADLIGHWKFDGADSTSDLIGNWGDLILTGNVSISNGKLDVNSGSSSMARTSSYSGPTITNKTLVSYLSLDNLNVRSGSGITLDAVNSDKFDGVIYAEREVKRWMSGSSSFSRTQDMSPGYAESSANIPVMVAITYEQVNTNQVKISLYRNGIAYGSYTSNNLASWTANDAEILFGARHYYNSSGSQIGSLDAKIDEAMIFGKALTAQEVADLYLDSSRFSVATVTIIDNIAPTAVTKNITVYLDGNGEASITTSDIDDGSSDNCSVSLSIDISEFDCGTTGATYTKTVTLTATDPSGNTDTETATVTVKDNIAPTAVTKNITVYLNGNGEASITTSDIDDGSSDNCSVSLSIDISEFDCGTTGTTYSKTVTLTATDPSGNTDTETATVTVKDNVAPAAVTKNITVYLDGNGEASITASDIDNGSSDNCSVSLSIDISEFDCGTTGTTYTKTVTLTATDPSGNTDTETATVTVKDNVAPTAATKNATIYLDANGEASITTSDIDNGSDDNCTFSLGLDVTDFDCSNVGVTNTVTLTVVDVNGNSDTETATVTVLDNTDPVAICQDVEVTLSSGAASITTGDINNGSYDNCSFTLALDITAFDCGDIGDNTVTMTATDATGNTHTCTANVEVIGVIPSVTIADAELPEFCQGGTIVLIANATDGASFDYEWSTGETADEIQVSSADTFSVEVTNNYGCTASDDFYVDYDREDLVSAYTIISFNKEVKLDESTVSTGAVTALGYKGKVDVDKDSKVSGSSTFVKADEVKVKSGGVVDTKIEEEASLTLPSFQYNTHCNSNNDVTVGSNTSVTLTDSVYGKVKVGKNSKVTFTSDVLYMEDFKTSYDDTIKFTQSCVTMYVCKKVELKKNNIFNAEGKSVLIFVEEDFKIEKNSSAITSVYSEKHIHSDGDKNGDENELTGLFIAEKIHSKRTNWNWNTACGGCQSTQNKVTTKPVADLSGLIDATQLILNVYPNPNNGNFGVDIFSPEDGNYQVDVYDAFGRLVYTTGKQVLSGPTYVPIELEATAKAQYFVRMSVNGEVFTKAILVRID